LRVKIGLELVAALRNNGMKDALPRHPAQFCEADLPSVLLR